jgi:multiple sugar transport system substrate-binding protein
MIKKLLMCLLVLAFASEGLLFSAPKTSNEVYFMIRGTPQEIQLWRKIMRLFQKENPDLKVRMEDVPYSQYWTKLLTMSAGGSAPDVVFLESTRLPGFIKTDLLLPLDDFLKADKSFKSDDFYPQSIASFTYKGKLYGIPNDMAIYAIYYNKNLFDQKGVAYPKDNWTWDDFMKTAKSVMVD